MNLRHPLLVLIAVLGILTSACGRGDTVDSGGVGGADSPTGLTLNVYSAGGLGAWYRARFEQFTEETGIKVDLVEAGSGETVARAQDEKSKADLLVVLPPFIQKAAQAGMLQPSDVDVTGITSQVVGPAAIYVPIVNNALAFIANPGANPRPVTWEDLLNPAFKGKLQYSTPGEAGDGTAMLLLLQHLMGKQAALDFLSKLQASNVGPSSSTSALQPKVSSGELMVANGDVQMNLASINNDGSNFSIFFPAMPDGSRTTISIPYVAGVMVASPHPVEAKRLLAYLLSEGVQKTVATEAFGIPVLDSVAREAAGETGVQTPTSLLKDVRMWVPEWTAVLAGIDADVAAYRETVGN